MKIIVNAYNLVVGGGLSVGLGVIKSIYLTKENDEFYVFLPKNRGYNFSSTDKVKIHYLPSILTDYLAGRLLINWYLSYKVARINAEVIFSMGNYAIPSSCKQLLLLQWPYAVYPESLVWERMSMIAFVRRKIRFFLFKLNLSYATSLTVQTEIMKERVSRYINYKRDIHIVESAGLKSDHAVPEEIFKAGERNGYKILLCMSEYYSHKNLEILIPLAGLINQQGLKYRILVTISPTSGKAKKLLKEVNRRGLDTIIVNLGRIKPESAFGIYKNCDALLLPTLLESYGIPYVEAAQSKIPIFTSDLDFAHDMNGDGAWYFNPLSAENILQTIQSAFNDPKQLKEKVDKAFQKVNKVRSWEEITEEYLKIIKSL